MKTLKTLVLIALTILINNDFINAQEYRNGLGLRLGGLTTGINYKNYANSNSNWEIIAGFGYRSALFTGLYEVNRPITSTNGLSWYYGIGAHVGFFGPRGTYWIYKDRGRHIYFVDDGRQIFVPGVDGIVGMEYKFNNAPFVIGLDLKPFIDIYSGVHGYWDGALNVRFAF